MNTEVDRVGRRKNLVLQYHNSSVVIRIMEPCEMRCITDGLMHDC